jgi:ferrous iron transport protein B
MIAVRAHTVALLGNPNTGKTTLFNALCGMNQRVGNYPGVTVETKKGRCRIDGQTIDIIDLPGTYSLAPRSPDEMVAVEVILGQKAGEPKLDALVTIVDASNLERNLYLMTQALDAGVPVIVALNMVDVAEAQGLKIDVAALSRNLGVPVVPLQANKGKGIEDLKRELARLVDAPAQASPGPKFPEVFEKEVAAVGGRLGPAVPPFLVRRLLLDVGGQTERMMTERQGDGLAAEIVQARERLARAGCGVPAVEARTRYGWIRQATHGCVQRPKERVATWTDRIDHVLTNKFWGTLIFLTLMLGMFLSIFLAAEPLMGYIEDGQSLLADWVKGLLEPGALRSLLTDGVIGGVGSVVIFLPQILILFAFIAVLEDCGYMARAAYLMDKLMAKAGLNGKSFIPMLSSVACAIPGIMAARVIENRRDRFATILVAPLMSCSARLPVYFLFTAAFFTEGYPFWMPAVVLFSMYLIGLVLAPVVAYLLKSTVLRGETPAFVMEMPLYKMPSLRLIVRRSLESGWLFLRRAGTIILATMIVIWALRYFPRSNEAGESYEVKAAALETQLDAENEKDEEARDDQRIETLEGELKSVKQQWLQNSYLGRAGKWIEPAVRPLGWDWRIGVAALASFPAREVIIGALGLLFGEGETDPGDKEAMASLARRVQEETWDDNPKRKLFTGPVALSVMVFFALCAQCASTLAVIKRETNSWGWPIFSFVYMTTLAYVGALAVYQIGTALVGG